ncbi:MAG: hypothetical protein KIT33_01255 [Candidatus Kapabacteria bacterium]|nr:hypothetical protein [Ignavibacteriota bacterium]MCW5883576.1 hypothetical protein [Candidatus Kapabacteria bacterium]
MSLSENLAKIDRLFRPIASLMSPGFYIDFYSRARRDFLYRLSNDEPRNLDIENWKKPVKLWDIEFNNPIFNAAGMFKSGNGYQMSALEGAGAWLAGTSTSNPRAGNKKFDILHPFLSLPRTKSALNWLGLPNDGHIALAGKIKRFEKIKGCPVGVSVSADPGDSGALALKNLVEGMKILHQSGADFIELNESCPNVPHHDNNSETGLDNEMINRLEYIKDNFISQSNSKVPLIVKYSVDTKPELLDELIPMLIDMGFSGINLGNTSISYEDYMEFINPKELTSFKYFTENFGGGVSGKLIAAKSLNLTIKAARILKSLQTRNEFHIIRTGGIENSKDVQQTLDAGASLMQWYTGYFENFSIFGHKVYKNIISNNI